MEKVEVRVTSREMVKPSTPTPSHLKTLKLSLLDQRSPPIYTPVLLCYPSNPETSSSFLDITHLKSTLSEALSRFYPLASRFTDESTVDCTDHGVPFTVTRVINCPDISTFLSPCSEKLDQLVKFFPAQDSNLGSDRDVILSEMAPCAVQINVFDCGGFAIGCYCLHKILGDGPSMAAFLRYWASLAAGALPSPDIQPDFHAAPAAFPPCPVADLAPATPPPAVPGDQVELELAYKTFVFSARALSALQAKAASERVPNPSRVEVAVGLLWERALATAVPADSAGTAGATRLLLLSIDLRKRTLPPLPKGSIGNLSPQFVARAPSKETLLLQDLVAEVHAAIHKFKDIVQNEFQGATAGGGFEDWRESEARKGVLGAPSTGVYKGICWYQLGFSEVDFGFGKPIWIAPTDGNIEQIPVYNRWNFFRLIDHKDDGIEAWFSLEKKHMEKLECDPLFLEFASKGMVL